MNETLFNFSTLEEREEAVLDVLRYNPRATNKEISEQLDITLSQVMTTVKNIESKHRAHVHAVLDMEQFGFKAAFVFISVRGRQIDEVARRLSNLVFTQYIARVGGGTYDLLCMFRVRSLEDFNEFLRRELPAHVGAGRIDSFASLEIVKHVSMHVAFVPEHLETDFDKIRTSLMDELGSRLDEYDLTIVSELQINGRIASQSIARRHNLNPGTVRYRLKNLESRELIHFQTLTEAKLDQLNTIAFIRIVVELSKLSEIAERLSREQWMPYINITTGRSSIGGFIIAPSELDVEDFLAEQVRSIPGVESTEVYIVHKTYKNDLRFGWKAKFGPGNESGLLQFSGTKT